MMLISHQRRNMFDTQDKTLLQNIYLRKTEIYNINFKSQKLKIMVKITEFTKKRG